MRGLILTAGLGERLRPLTAVRAKPALEFLNVPMLAFPYHWMATLGLSDLTFNTHHLPDTVRTAAMHVVAPEVALHFTHEPAILGAGGGIWNARFNLTGPDFAVANGDAVVLFERPDDLQRMLAFHRQHDALATLLVCPLEGVGAKIPGVWTLDDGTVTGFGKERPTPDSRCFHYASFMILSERVWREYPEGNSNILYDVLLPRLNEGVHAFRVDDLHWFETGNQRDYLAATETCLTAWRDGTAAGRAARSVAEAYGPGFGARSDLARRRLIADSAEVAGDVTFDRFAVVGGEVRIDRGCRLSAAVILPGVHVPADTTLTDQISI